jgi:hypothetical protein
VRICRIVVNIINWLTVRLILVLPERVRLIVQTLRSHSILILEFDPALTHIRVFAFRIWSLKAMKFISAVRRNPTTIRRRV